MPPAGLHRVAAQVLDRDMMEGANDGPLEHRPMALQSIGVSHLVDILACRVLDGFVMARHPDIRRRLIGVDRCALLGVADNEVLECRLVGGLHDLGVNQVGGAVNHTRNRGLADRAAPGLLLQGYDLHPET